MILMMRNMFWSCIICAAKKSWIGFKDLKYGMDMDMSDMEVMDTKTKTQTEKNTRCFKDPIIFFKSRGCWGISGLQDGGHGVHDYEHGRHGGHGQLSM